MNDEHRSDQAPNISWSQPTGDSPSGTWGSPAAASSTTARPTPPQVVGQHTEVPEDAVSIGRSRSNVIVLDDMLVSRRHALITADEEGLLLRDLDSRNGTFVNGNRITAAHVHEGDRISVGASTFEVRDGWLMSV